MKYKFKIQYTCGCFPTENKTIEKDEVVEVVRFREAGSDKFVSCLNEEGYFFVISLDVLKFCAEEYYEPQKRKTCPTCKHKEKCEELTKDWGIFLLGDTCARYEESTKEEPND